MNKAMTVTDVLNIEASQYKRVNIIDIKNLVVCYTGATSKFRANKDMSVYYDNVKTRPVEKVTTNGETLNLFIR